MNPIAETEAFLKETFENSAYLTAHPADCNYRLEHTYRVANIAAVIASKEGLDQEALVIAALLHDIAYCEEMKVEADWSNHGRRSAAIARPFLTQLGLSPDRIQEILYGIAIHVDDKADFTGEHTAFACSVGDADNIDRFDAYRIYEGLQCTGFSSMILEEKRTYVETRLQRLEKLLQLAFATKTAEAMWQERLHFQKTFFLNLQAQLRSSTQIALP